MERMQGGININMSLISEEVINKLGEQWRGKFIHLEDSNCKSSYSLQQKIDLFNDSPRLNAIGVN